MDLYQLLGTQPNDRVLGFTPLMQNVLETSTPYKTRGDPKILILAKAKGTRKAAKPDKKNQQKAASSPHQKSNPELAQFVDQFNHSLEDATSKPLDIS